MTLSMYLFWLCWMIISPFASSLFMIHLMPCNCGSIINGQRLALVIMAPFSTESGSVGKPSFAHFAFVASLVRRSRGTIPEVIGICFSITSGSHLSLVSSWRNCVLKGPAYETNAEAINTSPTKRPSTSSKRLISMFQRVFSPDNPLIKRSANCALRPVRSAWAIAAFLSSVAFINPTSNAATRSWSSLTLARMPASFLFAPSSFLFASASAARFGATTW
mmetsp:Transcript_6707/g.13097  ORF Transcript_6707/g.13097 Transcript_6707/m.13097 type:complete len:220 (-) Transcript_6707:4114-4773(-)